MPAWVWWGLISIGLCGLSWLYGPLSRQQAPAGHGPWEMSWAVYFSPDGGATHAILEGIKGAKHTILVQAYLLYSTRLAGALVRAHQRGVRVHVILDANAQPHHPPVSAVARLVAAEIAVSLDAQHAWAHDKVMILDGEIVITGSFNWTVAAERNNSENVLVIRDPRLAGVYTENWRRHAHHSTPYRLTIPWWAPLRMVWVSLTRRRPKQLDSDMGEDSRGARREERGVTMGVLKKRGVYRIDYHVSGHRKREGSVANFNFWGKIRKSGIRNSIAYRCQPTFRTEPLMLMNM